MHYVLHVLYILISVMVVSANLKKKIHRIFRSCKSETPLRYKAIAVCIKKIKFTLKDSVC